MKKSRKIISLLLSVLMIITSVPLMAVESFAADVVRSGTTGECTWTLDSDGVLTISGNGKMADYKYNNVAPWRTSITKVVIENGVTSIGDAAFWNCTLLESVTIENRVTSIGDYAFNNCTSLTSVTIPDSVTSIGDAAFGDCTSLESVTIGNGVTEIGWNAFLNCTSLTSINISDSVTSIGDCAFYNCTSLESVTIGNGVTSIGEEAFFGCASLKRIDVAEGNQNYASVDGILYNKDKTILIKYPAGRGADESCITPDSVEEIASGAFNDCKAVKELVFPKNLKAIANDVSNNPVKIDTLTVNCELNEGNIYEILPGYERFLIGATGGEIEAHREVNLNAAVGELGIEQFGLYCESVNILYDDPDFCTEDGVVYTKDKTTLVKVPCYRKKAYQIPSNVTNISALAFVACGYLNEITIPAMVTTIESEDLNFDIYGFFSETAFEKINVDENNENYSSVDGVLYNKDKTELLKYPTLKESKVFIIPDSVTSIDKRAFENCTSLKRIYIPDTVTTIGEKAFGYRNDEAIEGFTIIGKPGSAAQAYAEENGFTFVSPESIKVSKLPDKVTYCIGDSFDPTGIVVSYVNNDGSEDAINAKFTITGFDSSAVGKNTITVAYDGKTATFDVEIKTPSISLSESSLAFDLIGKTATLTATAVPSDSEIVWKSSNENVATVENGVVTAKGAGTATITATITVNGIEYSAECAVDVNLPTMSFPDVTDGDWYYDAVKYNFERGYITGYSNGTFGPSNNIQRQDFVLILARIAGADLSAYEGQNGGFSDVQTGSYYASAVAWAKDTGVANGFSADNFGVGTFISREQICIMLCRYLNGSASGNADTILNAYPDGGNTSPWAKAGVAWAVENGIIGNSDYLNPNGNAGRAEVAQIIYNMSNNGIL